MYTVYKHTAPNKKVYIGITCLLVDQRWRNGNGYHHNEYFSAAIKKYGWENFKHEILFTGLTKEEAEAKETELIAFYHSNDRLHGYNFDSGGSVNKSHSEETKEKIRKAHIGMKYDPLFGEKQSLLKRGNKNRLGDKQSEECKRKISQKNKGKFAGDKNYFHTHKFYGKDNKNSKRVEKYDVDGNLIDSRESANSFAVEMGKKNAAHIIDVCKGKRKTAYGFVWKYAESAVNDGMVG